jgi:hypothetical protein
MTDAEIWELVLGNAANAMTSFGVYLTVTFAYLAASYLAGAKLSRLQTVLISGLYVFGAGSGLLTCVSHTHRAMLLQDMLVSKSEAYAKAFAVGGGFWTVYMAILLSAGMVVSLYFMYDVRRNAE